MSTDFYARLLPVDRFEQLVEDAAYTPLPADWSVVLTDVVGSTEAVRAGRYREVNYVGAASIAAVLNAAGRADLPFVFGGDGATLVVPPEHVGAGLAALAALQEHARDRLNLGLRVGTVPLHAVRAAGHEVAVARYQASENYAQALFRGTGLGWAEDQVKDPSTSDRWASRASPRESDGDPYEGLECRWQDVKSPRGETVSLLIEAVSDDRDVTYREVLGLIGEVYGADSAHPVALDRLRLATTPAKFGPEVRLRHPDRPLRRRATLWALNVIGRVLIRFGIETSETDWERYPKLFRASTDYRKFDGVLRMVLAGGPEERARLEAALDRLYEEGRLAYGLHVSDRAVLTCLVYRRMGQQVHFVDGAGGGYTSAAVGFKRRRKALAG
ncbi:DUF3095 domain-containing protein [Rubrivirga marina]|uniref:Adenylate cyclase n=1 Tax=Rubrivirga marina TaxID=1196024 RepID=A0A271IZS4_9BACT|nr:DUF3095 domain-containing protein [Rubrivirga marina]PAP76713.1 hypothetical protein BSZ37_09810 [Rubrivirga marina]